MTAKIQSAPAPSDGEAATRKRKAHKKSRLGCRNCKLRRVKCNEIQPMCDKCQDFGVMCNYDSTIPDLQPLSSASEVVQFDNTLEKSPLSTTKPVLDMVMATLQRDSLGPKWNRGVLRFDNADLARLDKFQSRTVLTIGIRKVARVFQKEVLHLAFTHRYLMHFVQALTACHDRYLCDMATARPTAGEAYHMNQALVAFQTILSRPIHDGDRDALLVASSFLGVMGFFSLEASSVEDVWPLVDCDMSWLNLSDGKKTVWKLATPLRKDSLWAKIGGLYEEDRAPVLEVADHSPSIFDHLCSDDPSSPAAAANPLYKTSRALVPLLDLECNESTWLEFLGFTCHVDPPYKAMLELRDPWALLILCYWYMKMCRASWWCSSRCILQGQAICLYLERFHSDDVVVQAALVKPRIEFGLAQRDGWGGISSAISIWRSESNLPWV